MARTKKEVALHVVATTGEVLPPGARTPAEWAAYIREPVEKASRAWVTYAERLIESEDELRERGEAGIMQLYLELKISARTGQRIKRIAQTPRLTDATHASHLPDSWMTLYELSTLTDVQWHYGLETGLINATMERKDIKEIRALTRVKDSPQQLGADERGRVQLFQAEATDFLERVKLASADLLLTDPPYASDIDDISEFAAGWLDTALSRVKPAGRAYVFIGASPDEVLAYLDAYEDYKSSTEEPLILKNILVWTYDNTLGPTPKMGYKSNNQFCLYFYGPDAPPLDIPVMLEQVTTQRVNTPDALHDHRHHTWQKPNLLAERFIRHSTTPGQLILDPFAGTGTFLAAGARLGRRCIGCDNDPAMLEICRSRGIEVVDDAA